MSKKIHEKPDASIMFSDVYQKIINKNTCICLGKLSSNSMLSYDDVKQEAYVAFVKAHNCYKPGIVPFIAFFQFVIKNYLGLVMGKSYKTVNKISENVSISEDSTSIFDYLMHSKDLDTLALDMFSPTEVTYIMFMLNPPELTKIELRFRPKQHRQIVRKKLNMTPHLERTLRRDIQEKLLQQIL